MRSPALTLLTMVRRAGAIFSGMFIGEFQLGGKGKSKCAASRVLFLVALKIPIFPFTKP
jgi:hypothetical protein